MKKDVITKLHSDFEEMVHTETETGTEFWLARDLQEPLGYARWENFAKVIGRAKTPCKNVIVIGGKDLSSLFARKRIPSIPGSKEFIGRRSTRINRSSARKQRFRCHGELFSLDLCLLMGDPYSFSFLE